MAAFTHSTSCYPLPEGLAHGTPVVVIEGQRGSSYATVQDAQGRDWCLFPLAGRLRVLVQATALANPPPIADDQRNLFTLAQ
jgi:hypothetical protein